MKSAGEIKVFKLGTESNDYSILFTEDYQSHIARTTADNCVSKAAIGKSLQTLFNFLLMAIATNLTLVNLMQI